MEKKHEAGEVVKKLKDHYSEDLGYYEEAFSHLVKYGYVDIEGERYAISSEEQERLLVGDDNFHVNSVFGAEKASDDVEDKDLIIEALEGLWEVESEDDTYALICSEVNECYLVVDKLYDLNSDGNLAPNKLNDLYLEVEKGNNPLISSRETALEEFETKHKNLKQQASSEEEALYREYLQGVKEGIGDDFLDVAMSREAFLQDLRVKKAKQKIEEYQNDRKYEKNTPLNLRNRNQFIIWKYELVKDKDGLPTGRITKVPYNPKTGNRAASNSRSSWSDFDTACNAVDKYNANGVGIMFANGLIGIDIDHCIDDEGNLSEQAQEITKAIDSYTEYSPSGKGLHIFCFGKIPDEGNKRDDVEIYSKDRFFTLTGDLFEGQFKKIPKAEVTQENLTAVYNKYVRRQSMIDMTREIPKAVRTLEDDAIVEKCLRSKNGEFFNKMFNQGICDKYRHKDGTPDFSSHDFELCAMIAYYTDDAAQIDRIFRTGMLMRPKWDEMRGSNTYGAVTVQRALRNRQLSRYNPQEIWLKDQWTKNSGNSNVSDDDVIKKACGSKRFNDIFNNGNMTYYMTKSGLPSVARHEASLILSLSNYTRDYAQIERILRKSKIVTADWDTKADGSSFTRGQRLIVQLMTRCGSAGNTAKKTSQNVMD